MSLNKITLIGWTGKDPEVKTLDNGTQKAAFTLATTKRGYTLPDGRTDRKVRKEGVVGLCGWRAPMYRVCQREQGDSQEWFAYE